LIALVQIGLHQIGDEEYFLCVFLFRKIERLAVEISASMNLSYDEVSKSKKIKFCYYSSVVCEHCQLVVLWRWNMIAVEVK